MHPQKLTSSNEEIMIVTSGGLFVIHRVICYFAVVVLVTHCLAMFFKYGLGHDIVFGLVPLFDFYEERNVPTYFSSLSLLFASALIFFVCRMMKSSKSSILTAWRTLGFGLILMSIDEFSDLRMILKRLLESFSGGHGIEAAGVGLTVAWTVPIAILVMLLGFYFLPFLRSLPRLYAINFSLAGVAFVLAALGLENVQGFHTAANGDIRDLPFMLLVTLEESMEIGSILYFQYFMIRYINENRDDSDALIVGATN